MTDDGVDDHDNGDPHARFLRGAVCAIADGDDDGADSPIHTVHKTRKILAMLPSTKTRRASCMGRSNVARPFYDCSTIDDYGRVSFMCSNLHLRRNTSSDA